MSLLADPPITSSKTAPAQAQHSEAADVRAFVLAGLRPSGISLLVVAVLILLTLFAGGAGFHDAAAYIAAAWLALHQVPLQLGADALGLMPLAATALLIGLTSRTARKLSSHVQGWKDVGLAIAGMVVGPILFSVLALVAVGQASVESQLNTPPTLSMLGWVASVHLFGAVIGLRKSMPAIPHRIVPGWVANAGEATRYATRLLFLSGLLASVTVIVVRWSAVESFMAAGHGDGGAFGLTVVSLLYLPNMAVYAVGVLCGSAITLGDGSISLFEVAQGQMPPLPLMAALPEGPAETWWQSALLVPLFVAFLTGRKCARLAEGRGAAIRMALVASVGCSVVSVLIAEVSGGVLGAIGYVGLSPAMFGLSVFVWFAMFSTLGAFFRVRVREPKAPKEPKEPKPAEPEVEETPVVEEDAAEEPSEPEPESKPEEDKKPGLVSSVVGALPIPFRKK
ncbi:DUF6350 family protein [Smaragdicoccus niigatensis]|uniref:cell division protein PerM n=1 Tax=Smaragdicoccus niigatensis TaxID=359359 RepID=UPI000374955F|nr:DUF6350 family protein [Smaragdicoccus niigatensis]